MDRHLPREFAAFLQHFSQIFALWAPNLETIAGGSRQGQRSGARDQEARRETTWLVRAGTSSPDPEGARFPLAPGLFRAIGLRHP
jgi:hypothetical protein